uniref:Uncharacterized protein n=1 Tax=Romanomermis culicivorax TaxID=13658 RepID=A0A915K423_ROMCU
MKEASGDSLYLMGGDLAQSDGSSLATAPTWAEFSMPELTSAARRVVPMRLALRPTCCAYAKHTNVFSKTS